MMKKLSALLLAGLMSALPGAEEKVVDAENNAPGRTIFDQGVEIFRVLAAEQPAGNLLFSPYSLQNAFALLYPGVKGESAKEFSRLGFGDNSPRDIAAFFAVSKQASRPREKWEGAPGKFNISNLLCLNQTEPDLLPEYRTTLQKFFKAQVLRKDFSKSEQTAGEINEFIAKQTEQLIQKLISPDAITRDLAMILLNTVYFEQNWANDFYVGGTKKADFQTGAKTKVRVDMMCREGDYCAFEAKDAGVKGIVLPYQDRRFDLLILMPSEPGADAGLGALGKLITSPRFTDFCRDFPGDAKRGAEVETTTVRLYLPRVNAANVNPLSLRKTLMKHGFSSVFDPGKAELSGINGDSRLFLSDAVQQVVFQMDEKGTRAAAATALMVARNCLPPPAEKVFRVDRPFVLALRDREKNALLFLARIENPVQFPTPAPKAE